MSDALTGHAVDGGRRWVHIRIDDIESDANSGFPGALAAGMRADMWSGASLREQVDDVMSRFDPRDGYIEPIVAEASMSGVFSLEAIGIARTEWRIWVSGIADEDSPLAAAALQVEPLARQLQGLRRHIQGVGCEPMDLAEVLHEMEQLAGRIAATPPWALNHPSLDELAEDGVLSRPSWLPLPIARAGSIARPPVELISLDAAVPDLDARTAEKVDLTSRGIRVGLPVPPVWERSKNAAGPLSETATDAFRAVVGAGAELEFDLGTPDEWFAGSPPRWICIDEYGSRVPIADLSRYRRRWAGVAIQLSLRNQPNGVSPTLLVSDEPEAGVHRTGEDRLVGGIRHLAGGDGRSGLVATHSPAFFDDPDARLLHVRRNHTGRSEVSVLEPNSAGRRLGHDQGRPPRPPACVRRRRG